MKNIHVLPNKEDVQHIYITSDEEIKVGDWYYLQKVGRIGSPTGAYKCKSKTASTLKIYPGNCKKIILTTNQDLIADGVQAIEDEFLEWFVKNPNCEEVDVKPLLSNNGRALFGYKITLPQETPEISDEAKERAKNYMALKGALDKRMYSEEDMIAFAEFIAKYPDKNKNVNGEMLHAKSKYDSSERTIDLLQEWFEQFKKK
jgi:hypothetical protein